MRSLGILCCGLLAACTADADSVRPDEDELFFPTGMAVAPDESVAFVANANSNLKYDSGAIMVLDLQIVDDIVAAWTGSGAIPMDNPDGDGENDGVDCFQDPEFSETLVCDESRFFNTEADVRIGNFATDVAIQDRGGGQLRLIVPTRGDPSIAWVDWDGSALSCNANQGLCAESNRLTNVETDVERPAIPEEPFSAYADSDNQFAIVTHLTTGSVSLIDSPRDSEAVVVTDVISGIFGADNVGLRGATGVVGNGNGIVYVGSRTEDRIQTFTVGRPANGELPYLIPGKWFFLDAVGAFAGGSSDTRGMTFSPDGERLFLVNRRPATLQVIDTSLTPAGVPKDEVIGATDICRQGSTVAIAGAGAEQRAYVSCFQDGQVYVVDPNSGVYVEDIILSGAGPYSVAAARNRNKVFVTNFLEDTISVIDISPTSPTRNRVVLRIGIPGAL